MANPVCGVSSYDPGCSQLTNITVKELKAQIVYLMALQLAAIGGTDYTQTLATTLYQDSQTGTIGFDKSHVLSAEVDVWLNKANAALTAGSGGTAPGFQDRMTIIACILNIPEADLDKMKLWLLCNLGRSAPYPQ